MALENILFLLGGLLLLVKGADYFVDASARIAKRFGVSDFIVGLTVVAVGTSIPELASSIAAALSDAPGLVTGNVVGSNIANIGLILGIAAIFGVLKTQRRIYERDGFMLMLSAVLFLIFAGDGEVLRWEGIVLLLMYLVYILFLLQTRSEKTRQHKFHDFLDFIADFRYVPRFKQVKKEEKRERVEWGKDFFKDGLIILGAGFAVVFGARFLVTGAIWLAQAFSIPNTLIGLSVIAIGTSLPELTVSIKAARKGLGGIVIGNIVGSNIANTFLVFGSAASLGAMPISETSTLYTIPLMAFFTLFLIYLMKKKKITRAWGILSVVLYVIFMVFAFVRGLA